MRPPASPARRAAPATTGAAGLLGVFLVAACLRPAITSVGPLLDDIGADTGLSNTLLGLLSSLPLLAFAAVSPFVQAPARRFGAERVVVVALTALAVGIVVRSLPAVAALWLGTAVLGAGIAVGNVLLPSVVRRDYPARVALVTGGYSAVLGAAAATASGVALPIADALGDGWRQALVVWVVPVVGTVAVWAVRARRRGPAVAAVPAAPPADRSAPMDASDAPDGAVRRPVWRSAAAWRMTIFMGLQSTSFYVFVSWLPAILTARHVSHAAAGWYLFTFQVVGIVAGLGVPVLLHHAGRDVAAAAVAVPMVLGCVGLVAAPSLALVWVVVAGAGSGASLVVALSLFSLNADDSTHAAQLSGMGQSFGYLLAAGGPVAAGWLRDTTGSWTPTLVALAVLAGVQSLVVVVGRGSASGRPAR